jgi:hypothetical protein
MQYYIQYPALTILFYPPLFYFLSAPFYAVFGISHQTALAVVMLHYIAAAFGLYLLARRWMSFGVALAVGLALMAAPGVALWGRQVMLEVPALAFAIWALLVLRRWGDQGTRAPLYLGTFLLLCAIYTKVSAIFLVPVAFAMLLTLRNRNIWRDRNAWLAAALFTAGMIPITILTLKFGQANVQSVTGIADSTVSRTTLAGWTWYARQVPEQLGLPLLGCAVIGGALLLVRRKLARTERADVILLAAWLLVGYAFFSVIDLKEARHSTLILPPLLLLFGLAAELVLIVPQAVAASLLVVAVTAFLTWRTAPVPEVHGYREAAAWIAREAPPNSIILFSGRRDGSFIFNLRALDDRRSLYTLRSDKLLLRIAVRRELGVAEKPLSESEIGELLDRHHVRYVVAESDFWTDLSVMARLQSVLRSEHFQELVRIPVNANIPTQDKELRLYRNTHTFPEGGTPLTLDLPIIGGSVEGRTGPEK